MLSVVSKYDGLIDLLAARSGTRIQLHFEEISAAVVGGLPASAYDHGAWWVNDPNRHSQAQAWLGAGWLVDAVDRGNHVVTFVRS